ncbi:MAG TPA: hypothetical protein VF503_01320 [Sphingobium sp.]|uniref:hypothetical protein n=1 Tax=Sphingobium sp. TaxID=1912891 RepID=UPI002ED69369
MASKAPTAARAAAKTRLVRMKTGMVGPDLHLVHGDEHPFDDTPGPNGEPSEAQRIVNADFGEFADGKA